MSRSSDRLRSSGEGRERRGPRHQETTVPKYLRSRAVRGRLHELDGDLPAAAATAYAEAARRGRERRRARRPGPPGRPRSARPSCRKVVSLSVLRPDSATPGPPTRSSTNRREEGHEPARDHRRAAGSDRLVGRQARRVHATGSGRRPSMTVQRLEHIGIVVDDLAAATAFFAALGLEWEAETNQSIALAPIRPTARVSPICATPTTSVEKT